jgi:hypothetical protein
VWDIGLSNLTRWSKLPRYNKKCSATGNVSSYSSGGVRSREETNAGDIVCTMHKTDEFKSSKFKAFLYWRFGTCHAFIPNLSHSRTIKFTF